MLLAKLLHETGSRLASPEKGGVGGLRICDLTEDSRTVMPGSLFVARAGLKVDARQHIPEALRSGAVAVLTDPSVSSSVVEGSGAALIHTDDVPRTLALIAERFYGNPSKKMRTVGVTGTNGKTSVAHFIHRLLNLSGVRCGMIGTVAIDDGFSMSEATLTTPPATDLSHALSKMVEAGCKACVLETSSHALDQGRVAGLHFDIGIFTNLSGDHLDYHGTMENYLSAKAILFQSLDEEALAIVNIDDPSWEKMINRCRARVLATSLRNTGDCTISRTKADATGMDVVMRGPWGEIEGHVSLFGEYNLSNLLQSVAASHELGVPAHKLAQAITLLEQPPGRLQPVRVGSEDPSFSVYVDYAHTDDALEKVLLAARPLVGATGQLYVVFGCGGDRDRTKRPRMADVACRLADQVIITSDNPRTESPGAIIDDVLRGVPDSARGRVRVDADRERAIRGAIDSARSHDAVVIAGKGHENYQLLPDGKGGVVRIHFDDREVARDAIREKLARDASQSLQA